MLLWYLRILRLSDVLIYGGPRDELQIVFADQLLVPLNELTDLFVSVF